MSSEPTSQSRWTRWTAWGLCAAPLLVVAAAGVRSAGLLPHTQLAADRPREKTEAERSAAARPDGITEKEWDETVAFLKVHSPNRFSQIRKIGKSPHEGLKRHLVSRYRGIADLKDDQPKLYQTRLRSFEVEDQIFGLCQQLQRNEGDRQQKQAELKSRVNEMVNLGLEERGQRIEFLEKALTDQKKTLDIDKKDRDRLVNERYQYFITHGIGARFDAPAKHVGKPTKPTPSSGSTEPSPDAPQ